MPKRKRRLPKMSAAVAAALNHELARAGQTWEEAIAGMGEVPDPATFTGVLKGWNDLTPLQKAAWEHAATRENLRSGWGGSAN